MLRKAIASGIIAFAAAPTAAQQADVTFFVIGKHANFAQADAGDPTPVDFSFFSEIFLTGDGDANQAVLEFPTGERQPFKDMRLAEGGDQDNLLLVAGADRFTRADDLRARYPDGNYGVSFDTPSGNVDARLTFLPRPLPNAPVITVTQDNTPCSLLDANKDALVSWSPFDDGRADANGILDDLVFVILTDGEGIRVAHSGRPFEGRPYLTYAASNFTIDSEALQPGQSYTLSVEHALLDDTTEFDGVPGFTTRAVTTKLALATAVKPGLSCRSPEL